MSLGLICKRSFHGQADICLPDIGVHALTPRAWLRALPVATLPIMMAGPMKSPERLSPFDGLMTALRTGGS
jgi:hypothetical protein